MVETHDHRFMAHALELAEKGLFTCDPNPRVGCVLVKNNQIIGQGWHQRIGHAHAEVNAIANATSDTAGSTAYVTLEPCCHHGRTAPCTDALIAARISRVVAAMQDPDERVAGKGFQLLRAAGIEVNVGVMAQQARALNPGFIKRMEQQRPWVRCKLAMSIDGRSALADGTSQWITASQARTEVQCLRARSSAIVTGIGTLLADDPSLNVRIANCERQPLRVILDRKLRTPVAAQTLRLPGQVLIITTLPEQQQHRLLRDAGAEVLVIADNPSATLLAHVLNILAQREVNEVHLECGAVLAGAFLSAQLIDEIVLYMAPHIMGDSARGLFHMPVLRNMDERIALDIIAIHAVGDDWRINAQPRYHRSE